MTDWTLVPAGFALLFALAMSACAPSVGSCTPGMAISCPCAGGGTTVQTCLANRTYGPCSCAESDAGAAIDVARRPDVVITSDNPAAVDTVSTTVDMGFTPDVIASRDSGAPDTGVPHVCRGAWWGGSGSSAIDLDVTYVAPDAPPTNCTVRLSVGGVEQTPVSCIARDGDAYFRASPPGSTTPEAYQLTCPVTGSGTLERMMGTVVIPMMRGTRM